VRSSTRGDGKDWIIEVEKKINLQDQNNDRDHDQKSGDKSIIFNLFFH